jgi:hypothetical protein
VARPAAVAAEEGVRRAGVAVADHEPVRRRDQGRPLQRRGHREAPVALVPGRPVQPAGRRLLACVGDALSGAPGEGAPFYREGIVQCAQARADRGDRGGRVSRPAGAHRVATGQRGGHQPRAVLVAALAERPRHRVVLPGPGHPARLARQVEAAAGRRPLDEAAPRARAGLEGKPAGLVGPRERQALAARRRDHGRGHRRSGTRHAPTVSPGRDGRLTLSRAGRPGAPGAGRAGPTAAAWCRDWRSGLLARPPAAPRAPAAGFPVCL